MPVADEKAFLEFINSKDIKPEKNEDGSYKVDVPNSPLGSPTSASLITTFTSRWAKRTTSLSTLLEPSKVLPAKFNGVLSITLDIDKIPTELKKVAIGQTALQLAELKEKKNPDETPTQHKLQEATLDEMADLVKTVLNDGGMVTMDVNVDREKGDLSASLSLAGKPGTKLAKTFADLGTAQSIGASVATKDSAANALFHLSLPERLRKAMEPVFDESIKKTLDEEKDKETCRRRETVQGIRADAESGRAGHGRQPAWPVGEGPVRDGPGGEGQGWGATTSTRRLLRPGPDAARKGSAPTSR